MRHSAQKSTFALSCGERVLKILFVKASLDQFRNSHASLVRTLYYYSLISYLCICSCLEAVGSWDDRAISWVAAALPGFILVLAGPRIAYALIKRALDFRYDMRSVGSTFEEFKSKCRQLDAQSSAGH